MLERVDRIQLAVTDRATVAEAFRRLLAAEQIRDDAVAPLAARRSTLRMGAAEVELLSPDGTGPVADHLATHGPGLFAAGFASSRVDELRARFVGRDLAFAESDGQLFLPPESTGRHGLRCVVSPLAAHASASADVVSAFYEVTNLVEDSAAASREYADLFALDQSRFTLIDSKEFGYAGLLTLFDPADRLDRIECITPYDFTKTMGRFMRKHGESLYMCFAEAPTLAPLVARLQEHAPDDWSAAPGSSEDTLFIHPRALGGLLMGVSRASVGWMWSGHPERVRRVR